MRIWFNHWFSTAWHLINLMRQAVDGPITFVGSGSDPRAVYRQACDEWHAEQALQPEAYVDFCLDFCERHDIDVFVPRRGLTAIARASARFEALGVRLLVGTDGDTAAMLDDKALAYRFFRDRLPGIVPEHRVVRSVEEFSSALDALTAPSGRLCYKLCVDEGARSFRVIDDTIESSGALLNKPGTKVTRRAAERILSGYDFSVPVMVMPWLSGADVSVDCLETDSGRIVLPRFKVGRYSEVRPDREIESLCGAVMDALKPQMPVNIQFKLEGGRPWLMEVNPRMSGGLQLSCLVTGVNVPALALRKLLGLPLEWKLPDPWTARGVVNLETPIAVSGG